MKVKGTRPLRIFLLAISVAIIALLLVRCTVDESPTIQRIGTLATDDLTVELRPQFYSPYHLVIGVPGGTEESPPFRGEIEIYSPDGTTHSIPIASQTSEHSNWLHDPAITGFVLASDDFQQFSNIFQRGKVYRIRISFTEPPPKDCSLWFSSMLHLSIISNGRGE